MLYNLPFACRQGKVLSRASVCKVSSLRGFCANPGTFTCPALSPMSSQGPKTTLGTISGAANPMEGRQSLYGLSPCNPQRGLCQPCASSSRSSNLPQSFPPSFPAPATTPVLVIRPRALQPSKSKILRDDAAHEPRQGRVAQDGAATSKDARRRRQSDKCVERPQEGPEAPRRSSRGPS